MNISPPRSDAGERHGQSDSAVKRLPIPVPERLQVDESGSELRISWSWFNPGGLFFLVFGVCACGLVFAFLRPAGDQKMPMEGWLVLGPIALAAFVITYISLAGLLNRTTVRVNHHQLTLRIGPLPWVGNLTVDSNCIDQLYCTEVKKVFRNDQHLDRPAGIQTHYSYSVHFVTKANRRHVLTSAIREQDQALFLEQKIEEFLGIEDRRMEAEISRSKNVPGSARSADSASRVDPDQSEPGQTTFVYEAMDAEGKTVRGRLSAGSAADAQRQLRNQSLFVTELKQDRS
ncbi:MAG: hypothetical protein WKF77_32000 [Planctomycetaceae bacterium]